MVFEASDQGIPDDAMPLSGMVLRSDVQPEGGLVVGSKVSDKAPDATIALSMDMSKRRYDHMSEAERRCCRFRGVLLWGISHSFSHNTL